MLPNDLQQYPGLRPISPLTWTKWAIKHEQILQVNDVMCPRIIQAIKFRMHSRGLESELRWSHASQLMAFSQINNYHSQEDC
jgi:hypothetical protein